MKKHIRILGLLIVSFAMSITLAACRGSASNTQQEGKPGIPANNSKETTQTNTQQDSDPSTYKSSSKPQYFFVNGYLLGSYEADGWHSLCDTSDHGKSSGDSKIFYAKDLIDQDSYYVYDGRKLLGISKQIIWLTEETSGLGTFENADAAGKFEKYGKLYNYQGESNAYSRIFDLPVKLGEELSKLEIPKYGFHTEFVYGEKWNRDISSRSLVTNRSVNLFPKSPSYDVEATPEVKQLITDLFKENGMENTIPNFTHCIRGDFDGDNKDEYLMIASSPKSKDGWPMIAGEGKKDKVGVFSAIFYQDDKGSVQTLYSRMFPMKKAVEFAKGYKEVQYAEYCFSIDSPTAADLNGDGIYEIIALSNQWERGSALVYSLDRNGVYSVVLRSNWGL